MINNNESGLSPSQLILTPENVQLQASRISSTLGYKVLRFYVDSRGLPAKEQTEQIAEFYYSPSGGTVRDVNLNVVVYYARLDQNKGIGKAD